MHKFYMDDKDLKKLIGKKVKVDYLVWGDLSRYTGILKRVNKCSIVVDSKKIDKRGMDIKEVN